MKRFFLFFALLLCTLQVSAQQQRYKIGCIGFYNFENLFDTLDTPNVRDTEFTPDGPKNYDTDIYYRKIGQLVRVVSELGIDKTPDGVSILGVSEVENRSVLEDFVRHPKVADRDYQIPDNIWADRVGHRCSPTLSAQILSGIW